MSAAPETRPPPRRRALRRMLLVLATIVVLLLAVAAAGIYWLLETPAGARFAFSRVSGVLGEGTRIEGVRGALGGPLSIARLEIDRPDLYILVEDVDMATTFFSGFAGLDVKRLHARNIEVRTASSQAAATLPLTLEPPYPLRLDDGVVQTLRYGVIGPRGKAAKDAAARAAARAVERAGDLVLHDVVVKGEGTRTRWTIAEASVTSEYGRAKLAGTLSTVKPYPLELALEYSGRLEGRAASAAGKAHGTLEHFQADLEAEVSGTRAAVTATLAPFAGNPLVKGVISARGVDLARLREGLPTTRLDLEATMAPAGANAFAGPVRIANADAGPWDRGKLPFTLASAQVRIATGGEVRVGELAVALPDAGSARGSVAYANGRASADLKVEGVNLAALDGALQSTRLAGTISASGDAAAQRFDLALADPRFSIAGRGALASGRLEVPAVTVRTGGGSLAASGGMALEGAREFRIEGRASHFDPAAFVKARPGDLNFTFAASGVLQPEPSGEVRIALAASRLEGLPLSGDVYAKGDRTRIARADLHLAIGTARVAAQGSFGGKTDAMDVELHVPDLAPLAKPFELALAGRADAHAHLAGTFEAPSGQASLDAADLVLPSGVRVKDAKLEASAGSAVDSPIEAKLLAHGVVLEQAGSPTTLAEELHLSLAGTRAAHRLELEARMNPQATLALALQGGLDPRATHLAWDGIVNAFSLTGRTAFALASAASLHAESTRVELGDARLRGEWGDVHLALTRWTPETLDVKGESPGVRIQTLARSLRVEGMPRSSLVVAGSWEVHAARGFDAAIDLHRISGDVRVGEPEVALGLTELAFHAQATQGHARVGLDLAGERVGQVHGEGVVEVVRGKKGWEIAPDAPLEARLAARLPDIAVLASWLGPDAKSAGGLDANVALSGTREHPHLSGTLRGDDLQLREPQTGFEIEQGTVALRLDGRSLVVEKLHASTPWHAPDRAKQVIANAAQHAPGSIDASGSLDLAAGQGEVRIVLSGVPVMQLPTRFAALSGEARLVAKQKEVDAQADLKVDGGWIGALDTAPPSVSDDVVVVRASTPPLPEERGVMGERIRIDARLDLGNRLYLQGRGLDTRLMGALHLMGEPPGALTAEGVVRTVGGTYKGYGQKLTIERGVLQFRGPIDNPSVDVLAVRPDLPVVAGVEVQGTTSHLRVRLVSTPDVPEPEKLSWLVLGRGPSELQPGDASILVGAATSMLGRDPGDSFAKKLGFDEVGIARSNSNSVLGVLPESTVAGHTGTASATEVVTVGKSLSDKLHLSYEQGLSDAVGTVKLAWKITRQFELLARAGYLPGLDAVYRWTFK